MTARTFLVTGANRGLGLETCRQLKADGHRVILAARKLAAAEAAATTLDVEAVELDVTSAESVTRAAKVVSSSHDHVDVIVNNAGVYEAALELTSETNVRGPMRVIDAFRPMLPDTGAIVMVSSGMGTLSGKPRALVEGIEAATTRADVDALADAFAAGKFGSGGTYGVSKALLNAFTRVLATELAPIRVNAVCPGWVRTDMGGASAPRSVEVGARSIVVTALAGDDGPTGGFFRDGHAIGW